VFDLALKRRFQSEVEKLSAVRFDEDRLLSAMHILELAREFNVVIDLEGVAGYLSQELVARIRSLVITVSPEVIEEGFRIQAVASKLGIQLDIRPCQDELFSLLRQWHESPRLLDGLSKKVIDHVLDLARMLEMNTDEFKKQFEARAVTAKHEKVKG